MLNRNALTTAAVALIAAVAMGASTRTTLRVVATTPDLASIAREIGGDGVDVIALAKPTEDPHFVDAKPSHIVTLNRADVLIEGGAELEMGWLPPLLESSRNPRIAAGAPGRVVASNGVRMLEIPAAFDRSKGDVHALGNPHFLIDPGNARIVASAIAERFAQVDPESAALYRANLARFDSTLEARQARWHAQLRPHLGARFVSYHRDFVYLADRFKLEVVETLEPKPGIAPSPAHITRVIQAMKATSTRVIVVQPYQSRRTAESVARQTGAVVLDLAQQPGARPGTKTYVEMMDYMVTSLVNAFANSK
jgi:ABC-type Zn uptake system ZnuABC Zn-binding protein ZnuA